MDLSVKEFLDGLFKEETVDLPSDVERPDMKTMSLPPWYDKDKFDRGRKFYRENCFSLGCALFYGLLAVLSIPSSLNVVRSTQRSSSVYTAYKRYAPMFLLMLTWLEHELKPGSVSWKTLHLARLRHFKASFTSKKKGVGVVSQRDLSFTLYGIFGFALQKPSVLGATAAQPGDWEALIHTWATLGYMLGIEDRYNICRLNIDETRQVFKAVRDKVYKPCLENVPEYYEHMARVLLDGMFWVNPISDTSCIYFCKYFCNVPGYILTEEERFEFQNVLKARLQDKPIDTGVDSRSLIDQSVVKGLPTDMPPRYFYLKDFDTLSDVPAYKRLSLYTKFKINLHYIQLFLCNFVIGRFIMNLIFRLVILQMRYFPWLAGLRFGLREAYVDMMELSPMDNTVPLPNSDYYKKHMFT